MASPLGARTARALAAGLGTAALAAMLPLGLAQPAAASTPICTSTSHPNLAAKLSRDIAAALAGRTDTYAVTVWDPHTGVYCSVNSNHHFDSASTVKATIMGAVLRRAQEQHRSLTSWEVANLRTMIENSSNTGATNLWNSVGRSRMQAFLNLVGMNNTVLGPGGFWGLTQETSRDEMKLLDVYTDRSDVLNSASKAYGLKLMASVEADQRWGTPYGTPAGVTAHNKNGWLPRASRGWRVHSLGIFTGNGRNYRMDVLTDNQSSMGYGITTIERVALAVHRDIGAIRAASVVRSPSPHATAQAPAGPSLAAPGADTPRTTRGDGSAPFGRVGG